MMAWMSEKPDKKRGPRDEVGPRGQTLLVKRYEKLP